jgi:hypothetical protein
VSPFEFLPYIFVRVSIVPHPRGKCKGRFAPRAGVIFVFFAHIFGVCNQHQKFAFTFAPNLVFT